jgi:uncharacterized delta-60 repeat protein
MKRIFYTSWFLLSVFCSSSQPGSLDPGFNGTGKVLTSFYYDYGNGPEIAGSDYGYAVAVQADGKVVVAGSSYNGINEDFGLARFNTDGSLDSSFGDDGRMTTEFGTGNYGERDFGYAIAIQTDGKILVAGSSQKTGSPGDFALARYNTNGYLDSTFDSDGKLLTNFGEVAFLTCLAIQGDGKIVAAGYGMNVDNIDFFLARYHTNGSLDSSFDGDGKLISPFSTRTDEIYAIAIQSDGKIVVTGRTDSSFTNDIALARYNTDGSLDSSFDIDGKVVTAISSGGGFAHGIAMQSNGKIVVAGYAYSSTSFNNDFVLLRYNTDGSPDNSFDADGRVMTPVGSGQDYATSVAIQPDGKIIVAGTKENNVAPYSDFALVRYNSNGSLDMGFDGDGKAFVDMGNPGPGIDRCNAIALTNDRIYIAGYSYLPYYFFAVAAIQTNISVLPVSLLSFTATIQANSVGLQWKTSSEQNTSRFLIERSSDGINFVSIGTVAAAGSSADVKNYSFPDLQPLPGTGFYRLKMIDADDRFTYSRTVIVNMRALTKKLLLFPNPVNDQLQIRAIGINETVTLLISDVSGRILKQEKIQLTGSTSFTVDVHGLTKGNYFLVLKWKGTEEIQEFIKN